MTTRINRPKTPRRARLLALVAGLLGAAALLPAGANAATVQSQTDAWLQYQPPTGVTPFIFGGFSTEKRACEKRTISVYRSTDLMNWDYIWHTEKVSGPNPGLTKYLQNADRNHYYVLSVHKRTKTTRTGKVIECLPDQSEAVLAN